MGERLEAGPRVPGKPDAMEYLHPAWRTFIQFCAQLRHGEIERLSIQDGVPVLAEQTTKKIKFTG